MKKVCFLVLVSTIVSNCYGDVGYNISKEEKEDLEKYNAEVDRLFSMVKEAKRTGKPLQLPDIYPTTVPSESEGEITEIGEHNFKRASSISKSEPLNKFQSDSSYDYDLHSGRSYGSKSPAKSHFSNEQSILSSKPSTEGDLDFLNDDSSISDELFSSGDNHYSTSPSVKSSIDNDKKNNSDSKKSEKPSAIKRLFISVIHPAYVRNTTEKSSEIGCSGDVDHIYEIFKQCINPQSELSASINKNRGSMNDQINEKFLKYCLRAPVIRTCIKTYIFDMMESCIDEGVRETINNVEEVTKAVIRFMCRNEADRVSLLIVEGGVDCLHSAKGFASVCLAYHFGGTILSSLFDMPFGPNKDDECSHISEAQKCVHRQFDACLDPTLAKVVWVMFDIAREISSCAAVQRQETATQSFDVSESTDPEDVYEDEDQLDGTMEDVDVDTISGNEHIASKTVGGGEDLTQRMVQSPGLPEVPIDSTQQHKEENSTELYLNASVTNVAVLSTLVMSVLLAFNL